jgi:hypothetical protein
MYQANMVNLAMLLIVAGDIEFNPGPYPCGICIKTVRKNQESVCCDTCEQWFHRKCMNMAPSVFRGQLIIPSHGIVAIVDYFQRRTLV